MFRQSLNTLLVVSLLGLVSCGTTQLGAAKHKESLPSTVLLAVATVVELPSPATSRDVTGVISDGSHHSLESISGDLDLVTPNFRPVSQIIIDLGVGEAPYDDGFLDYALDFSPLVGFSDALMQLEYRAQLQPGTSVFGIAAMNRVQDETILQAMGENDWAWFAFGVQFSW